MSEVRVGSEMTLSTVHPFPARMAPDVAWRSIASLEAGAQVLDPMCGSGTVLRVAVEHGLDCVGIDVDPLSVLMSRVWTTPLDGDDIWQSALMVVEQARQLSDERIWSTSDEDTQQYVTYWFAKPQREAIARLVAVLRDDSGTVFDALAVALSRIIVTKEMMASLARDASHSRPHRVAVRNHFDVYGGFLRSAKVIARRLRSDSILGRSTVELGDARRLDGVADNSIDLVLTSPPYLNAIDYLRGHRLALVWLGYSLSELRHIRAESVGAERMVGIEEDGIDLSPFVRTGRSSRIQARHIGWVRRYAVDMRAVLGQARRVVADSGRVVMVVGDSILRGARVRNAELLQMLAADVGLHCCGREVREIPARRRYLPPPGKGGGALDTRMRRETVMSFTV